MALVGLRHYAQADAAVARGLIYSPVSSELLGLQSALGRLRERQPPPQRPKKATSMAAVGPSPAANINTAGAVDALHSALATLEKAGETHCFTPFSALQNHPVHLAWPRTQIWPAVLIRCSLPSPHWKRQVWPTAEKHLLLHQSSLPCACLVLIAYA
jgi:hypothetical protein